MRIGKLVRYIKKSFRSDSGYAIILSAIFTVFGIILALRHEMWRDEVNVWLIARDHSSVIEILRHLRYDGHPGLWHLCVFAMKYVFPHPIAMQMLHLIIAATTVYLFVRFSPFTRLQKALFAFSYFPFYEYAIITRNYALGILLLFLFCVLFSKRFERFPLVGFILFLLAHTSVHALIIAISIGIALFVEYIFSAEKRQETNKLQISIGFSLIAVGVITSFFQLKPPPDYGFAVGWTTKFDLQHLRNVLNIISKAFIPVPQFTFLFWGSNVLDKLPSSITVHLVLSSLILLWAILLLVRKPIALLMYIAGTLGLLTFFYIKYFGGIRHWGFLFMLFLSSVWIEKYYRDIEFKWKPLNGISMAFRKHRSKVLTLVLVIHLVGGVVAAQYDYRYIFSQARATAKFIKKEKLDDLLIAGDEYTGVAPVSGYLGEKLYYPRVHRVGSFWILKKGWLPNVTPDEVLKEVKAFGEKMGRDVLIILNYPLDEQMVERYSLTKVAEFVGAIVGYEQYYLYLGKEAYDAKN